MRIEEVKQMEALAITYDYDEVSRKALAALRAEAWHTVENAEELGVDSGSRYLVSYKGLPSQDFAVFIHGKWYEAGVEVFPTHFKLEVTPPVVA